LFVGEEISPDLFWFQYFIPPFAGSAILDSVVVVYCRVYLVNTYGLNIIFSFDLEGVFLTVVGLDKPPRALITF